VSKVRYIIGLCFSWPQGGVGTIAGPVAAPAQPLATDTDVAAMETDHSNLYSPAVDSIWQCPGWEAVLARQPGQANTVRMIINIIVGAQYMMLYGDRTFGAVASGMHTSVCSSTGNWGHHVFSPEMPNHLSVG
jgi:hypothetical protein